MGDDAPKVEPLGEGGREERRPRPIGAVVAAAAVGSTVLFLLTTPDALPRAPTSTTTTTLPTTTTSDPTLRFGTLPTPIRARTLADIIPEYDGVLRVIEGDTLLTWRGERSAAPSLLTPGDRLHFDASDRLVATLASASDGSAVPLLVGAPGEPGMLQLDDPVAGFVWHATVPGRLAWIRGGEAPGLCWADLAWMSPMPDLVSPPSCTPSAAPGLLVFDDLGFIAGEVGGAVVTRLDPEGTVVASLFPALGARVRPDGGILITQAGPDGSLVFRVADPTLTEIGDPLPQASSSGPLYQALVAPSPLHPIRHAYLFPISGERYRVEVLYENGRRVAAFNLEGRVWDLDWDSTGRYLLAPGIIEETDHVLYVLDTATREVTVLPFADWVQDAALVMPRCVKRRRRSSRVGMPAFPPTSS